MKPVVLIRYSEIGLKGKNRDWYEKKLIENIRYALRAAAIAVGPVERRFGRIILHTGADLSLLKRVFGIASFSAARETPLDITKMANAALHLTDLNPHVSFRVTCQRLDKTTEKNSQQIQKELGAELVERTQAEVDLTEYDVNVNVEIINKKAYVFVDKTSCFGGLPVSTQGTVLTLIENKNDVLAALLMLRRGCTVIPISYSENTYDVLPRYGALAQRLIKKDEIDTTARETNAEAVVVGQTFKNIGEVPTTLLVLRPLVGMTPKQITERLDEFMHN